MASIMKFLCAALLLLLLSKGAYTHSQDKVSLAQNGTGDLYLRKPVCNVTIHNGCTECVVVNMSLSCPGFKTVKPIGPSVLEPSGDYCIISYGCQIYTDMTINFTYAWDFQYPLKIAHLDFACPAPP